MANYTEHYQLHQWEPSDSFLRTDFNQDFARIDTGMRAAKAQAERLIESFRARPERVYNDVLEALAVPSEPEE